MAQLPVSPDKALGFVRPTNTSSRDVDLFQLLHSLPSKYGNLGKPAPPITPIGVSDVMSPETESLMREENPFKRLGNLTNLLYEKVAGKPEFETLETPKGFVPRYITTDKTIAQMPVGPDGFYSKAEEVLNESKQGIFQGTQLLNFLKSKGVRDEELKWSGLAELGSKAKVTKEEALAQLMKAPRVGERVLTTDAKEFEKAKQAAFDTAKAVSQHEAMNIRQFGEYKDWPQDAHQFMTDLVEQYRRNLDQVNKLEKEISQYNRPELNLPGPSMNYREILLTHEPQDMGHEGFSQFESSHWDKPNVLAHLRLNERQSLNGAKVLHSEEYQSDWANLARKQGIKDPAFYQKYRTLLHEANQAHDEYMKTLVSGVDQKTRIAADNRSRALHDQLIEMRSRPEWVGLSGVNPAPFIEGSWPELAVKRHLLEAARDPEVKHVTWTTGAQQAERYALDKQLEWIRYTPNKEYLEFKTKEGHGTGQSVKKEDLSQWLGQELSDKLLATPTTGIRELFHGQQHISKMSDGTYGIVRRGAIQDDLGFFDTQEAALNFLRENNGTILSQKHVLRGTDLVIHNQGKRTFYDKVISQTFKRLTKEEPRLMDIQGDTRASNTGINLDAAQKVWSIPMTDELRARLIGSQNSQLAISKMTKASVIEPAKGLTEGGFFLDAAGNSHILKRATHEKALMQGGLMTSRKPGYSDIASALHDHQLIRVRETPTEIGLELGDHPTEAQSMALFNLLSRHPSKPVVLDLYKRGDIAGARFKNGSEAITKLFDFYPETATIKKIAGKGFPLYSVLPTTAHELNKKKDTQPPLPPRLAP